jgi:hypothetical protein
MPMPENYQNMNFFQRGGENFSAAVSIFQQL